MFNWRTVVGLVLLVFGCIKFYAAYLGASNNMGVSQGVTRITCLIWIAVGILLLYRGTRKNSGLQ